MPCIFTCRVVGKVAIVMAKVFMLDLYQQNVGISYTNGF